MAMDSIIKSLIEERGSDIMPAYLCTPTDAHLCTAASVEAAKANMRRVPAWHSIIAPFLGKIGMPVKKNVEKPIVDEAGNPIDGLHVVDCIVPEQGPNYCLAKRLQHWRAVVSREAGCKVSSNIAPSTATASVLSNVLFALSYKGLPSIKPMEITYQETSNAVMAALLIRDVRDPTSASNPKTPLQNPLSLMTDAAWHGGAWRAPWKFQSLGGPALLGYVTYAFAVTPYLLGYNLYQSWGWGQALNAVVQQSWIQGNKAGLWNNIGDHLGFFQHLGMMEVAHASLGLTRSSPFLTFLQIVSRFTVVAFINYCQDLIKDDVTWIPIMLTCWCIADFTRYAFYCVGLLRDIAGSARGVAVALKMMKVKSVERADDHVFKIPFPLVWLRYSLFIVLYPTGVFGELMVCNMTKQGMLSSLASLNLPDTVSGFTFRCFKFLFEGLGLLKSANIYYGAVIFIYLCGLPPLYLTLLGARKKQLAPPPKTDKTKKSQ